MDAALAERIREQARAAFADRVTAALVSGSEEDVEWVAALYAEMRDGLCALVPRRSDVHERLRASFDVDFLKQRLRHRAFDAPAVRSIVLSSYAALAQLQAPSRDGPTARQQEELLALLDEKGLAAAVAQFVLRFNDELEATAAEVRAIREAAARP